MLKVIRFRPPAMLSAAVYDAGLSSDLYMGLSRRISGRIEFVTTGIKVAILRAKDA